MNDDAGVLWLRLTFRTTLARLGPSGRTPELTSAAKPESIRLRFWGRAIPEASVPS
jgi:hypothetical protein